MIPNAKQPTRILALVLAAVTAGRVPALAQDTTPAKEVAEAAWAELRTRTEEQNNEDTRRHLKGFQGRIEQTTKAYEQLAQKLQAFSKRVETLLTSNDGKRIAKHPVAFMTFLRIQENPTISLAEVNANKDAVSAILNNVLRELRRVDVGFEFDQSIRDEVEKHFLWADRRIAQIDEQNGWVDTILKDAPTDIDFASTPTLKATLDDYQSRWIEFYGNWRLQGEHHAEPEAEGIVLDAAYRAKLEEAHNESQRIIDTQRIITEQRNLDLHLVLLRAERQMEEERVSAQIAHEDTMAELKRTKEHAAAERHLGDVNAQVAREDVLKDANKKLLVQRCNDPDVQAHLQPFLALGYRQPGVKGGTFEQQPMSLAALRNAGALEESVKGLQALVRIAIDPKDRERPRWPKEWTKWNKLTAQQKEEIKQAQTDLLELGEVMVELGMLSQ